MKTITKTAIIGGGAGLIAAYFLVIHPRQSVGREVETVKDSLIASKEIMRKFNRLPLKVHSFLEGIRLHSLDYVELNGGRERMTIVDIYNASGLAELDKIELGAASKALFWLRTQIGKIMRWDEVPELVRSVSYLPSLTAEERAKSLVPPGEMRGISQVLY